MQLSTHRAIYCTALAALALSIANGSASAQNVHPEIGLKIEHATSIERGTYHLKPTGAAAIVVSGKGYTLDFKGVTLLGDNAPADGIKVTGEDITIRNLDVSGFKWGVVLEGCKRVRFVNCKASWNANLKPGTVIDESGNAPEDDHGGGFVVRDSTDCHFEHCTAQHQWDGIDLVRSARVVIQNGDYSYCGNWGIHLWNSSFNVFRHNRAVWCTTGGGTLYQALSGWQTYDAQAVGIDHNSCDNIIEQNDLRFGGDGIFIRANEGPITPGTVVPVKNGSHRNKLLFNDCSFSPNNAIEVDLVDDTQIIGNNCSYSNYGLWLGYSRRCIVSGNTCVSDTNHCVEIENGQDDVFNYNVFSAGENARADYQMVLLRQNGRDKTPSGPYLFDKNSFYGRGTGVVLTDTAATLQNNTAYMLKGAPATAFSIVKADAASKVTAAQPLIGNTRQLKAILPTHTLVPGKDFTFRLREDIVEWPLPIVALDGIPLWVRSNKSGMVTVHIPEDNWLRPAANDMVLTIVDANGDTVSVPVKVAWPKAGAVITSVTPQAGAIGQTIVIKGQGLNSGRVL
jgi:parallel beta-helix repeat protein